MELNTFKPWLVKPSMGPSFGLSCSTFPLLQLARQPLGTCLDHQPQLNAKVRTILIDWLVDVAPNRLRTWTLF